MEHFRLRKYRGTDTWRRVREAYVAGESGPSLARRYDVGLANLRKKASREGWTRSAVAAELDRELPPDLKPEIWAAGVEADPGAPPDPPAVRRRALARADALLAEGRAAEALAQLKAAEALARLSAEEAGAAAMETWEADAEAVRIKVGRIVEDRALELAQAMLAEGVKPGVRWGGFALHWRAAAFGEEAAEADRRQAEAEGWAERYWDAEGRLRAREPGEMGKGG